MSLRVLLYNVPLEDSLQKAWFPCWRSQCLDPEASDLNNDWISRIQEVGPSWRKWVTGACLKDLPCPGPLPLFASQNSVPQALLLRSLPHCGPAQQGALTMELRLLSCEPASVLPPPAVFGWGVSTQWLKLTHLARSEPPTESARKIHMKDQLRFLFSLTWMSLML